MVYAYDYAEVFARNHLLDCNCTGLERTSRHLVFDLTPKALEVTSILVSMLPSKQVTRGTLAISRIYVPSKIGPSILESAVPSLNLKSQKFLKMCIPGIWVYQASDRCETQRKETPILTKREVRIINLGLLHSITAPVAMPEARPCRARLVLVRDWVIPK